MRPATRHLIAQRGPLFDAVLGVLLVALSNPQTKPADDVGSDRVLALWWAFTALAVTALLVQRRWPLPALILVGVSAIGHQLVVDPTQPHVPFPALIDFAVPIVLYHLASRSRSRWLPVVALATAVAVELAVSVSNGLLAHPDPGDTTAVESGVVPKNVTLQFAQHKIFWFECKR